ncbi:MAG TPA: SUMF1/EgtB/PvdO family nonheme iron enzyme [Polyangiaceae bacterium]|nr:SUMF1/EgtB/PvdO family nonheme iron enzyme [Polyangiaceae bacterium]
MKWLSVPVLAATAVGALGGAVAVWFVGDRLVPSLSPLPAHRVTPRLMARGDEVEAWLDRGLLAMANTELAALNQTETGVDAGGPSAPEPASLMEERAQLYRALIWEFGIAESQLALIRAIFEHSERLGQGNPACTVHPMTREQCRAARAKGALVANDERICGAPNMVAIYDPTHAEAARAKVCIDQLEFPNIPCEYPVVWVRASEAAELCHAMGKRLCDAHEWEGACAGALRDPSSEYESWDTRLRSELLHNQHRELVWATGFKPDGRTCPTGFFKSPGCIEPSWEACGSNTYPSGAFPNCVSPFGAYDMHGNVAEHMNLPLREDQLGARGGHGETEMKGSWFGFDSLHPHPDDCRWRALAWHATALDSENSHYNYHLGFRCCRDLD